MAKKKDATKPGVSEENPADDMTEEQKREIEEGARKKFHNDRMAVVNRIAAKNNPKLAREEGFEIDPGDEHLDEELDMITKKNKERDEAEEPKETEETPKPKEKESEKEKEEEQEPEQEKQAEETEETEETEKTPPEEQEEQKEIVVNGEKRMVPLSEVMDAGIRTLQKESAADKRLEEASGMKKQMEDMLAEFKKQTSKLSPKEDAEENEDNAQELDEDFENMVKQWADDLQYADTEDAAKVIKDIIKTARQGIPAMQSKDDVKKALKEMKEEEINRKMQAKEENGGFADIIKNPIWYGELYERISKSIKDGAPGDDWETYRTEGEKLRKEIREKSSGDTPTPKPKVNISKEKKDKKQQIDNIKSAHAKETPKPTEDIVTTEDEGRKAGIHWLAKARGQKLPE